jgi:hypothetical protein
MRQWTLLISVFAVVATAGCSVGIFGDEDATFACDRGFKTGDWESNPLKTGQSIAKCGWLKDWSQRRVRRVLGRPYGGSARNGIRYFLGDSKSSIGPAIWILTIRVDFDSRRVIGAVTDTEPV